MMLTHCATMLQRRGTVALVGSAPGEVLAGETPAPAHASNSMSILRIRRLSGSYRVVTGHGGHSAEIHTRDTCGHRELNAAWVAVEVEGTD